MLKFIVIGVALFLVYKLFIGDKKKKEMDEKKVQKDKVASGEMVKDPICGTYVDREGSIRVKEGEKVHTFCSYECRDKYLKQLNATTVNDDE
ncbi:TRASH domain-containing protein [Pseudodesulfovibrio profundus]|uniref:TRASH domain-containing protein n=1 Tax=Pseudodesulfovibrio profundus TaxID=57320 RepID=A0A2C8F3X2_9BACT|nr:transcriptional regulator [Pseudodesulfovibrio profundus]MBC18447.1 transcriptional regulator [Desulfovibrio sp.]SOB57294.1 TRASH domain-containing protein [Pseudodesulfovibrio profundus]|tara:strand:- start:449 stop:724 length:276 start_codon:yes stop_codon:yes gene_type:complete